MCLIGLLLTLPTQADAKEFRVGYFSVPPHAMPDQQEKPIGIAVDYFAAIANQMGVAEVRFHLIPLKRLLRALENNTIDMLLFAKNGERAKRFVYPARSFCMTQPAIASI